MCDCGLFCVRGLRCSAFAVRGVSVCVCLVEFANIWWRLKERAAALGNEYIAAMMALPLPAGNSVRSC